MKENEKETLNIKHEEKLNGKGIKKETYKNEIII